MARVWKGDGSGLEQGRLGFGTGMARVRNRDGTGVERGWHHRCSTGMATWVYNGDGTRGVEW